MVFTFLKARGVDVGNSLVEDDQVMHVHTYTRSTYIRTLDRHSSMADTTSSTSALDILAVSVVMLYVHRDRS
jgi:3-phosphoglycerate kinase